MSELPSAAERVMAILDASQHQPLSWNGALNLLHFIRMTSRQQQYVIPDALASSFANLILWYGSSIKHSLLLLQYVGTVIVSCHAVPLAQLF